MDSVVDPVVDVGGYEQEKDAGYLKRIEPPEEIHGVKKNVG